MLLMICNPLQANDIQNIRMGAHADKTRLVIDFTGKTDFQVQIPEKTNHLVIYFNDKTIAPPTQFIPPFESMRTSAQNGFLKITIPMISPHKIKNAYVIKGDPHRLVIDVVQGEGDNSIHGPLVLNTKQTQAPSNTKKPIIMIDAGHGGRDPGAISASGILEKNITLSIAKIFAKSLNNSGRYQAKMTREKDVFVTLHNRVAMAEEAKADLFISIHADSLRGEHAVGASVYTLSKDASDEQTAKLAARENMSDDTIFQDAQTDIHSILFDMAMRETQGQSKELANDIILSLQKFNIDTLKGPLRHAGFAVLKSPEIPSVLFETGFLSNEQQAQKLIDPSYQKQISNALLKSLDNYFGL